MRNVERIANKCENCPTVFYRLQCQLKATKKPYCSIKCYWDSKKNKTIKHFIEDKEIGVKISKSLTGKKQPLNQRERHHQWKGEDASYSSKHQWLAREYGKADMCENHLCVYPRKNKQNKVLLKPLRFEWSLIHGNEHGHFRERYWKLCASCHRIYDKQNI